MLDLTDLIFEEYGFIAIFGLLSWISSLQFAKLYPHNVKYGKYVLYLHCLLCVLGIYEVTISYFEPTQFRSIHTKHNSTQNTNYYVKLLYTLCIPSHFEIFITNFILFQWLKIYFSVGATEGWLVPFKWFMIILCSISFITLLTVTIVVTLPSYKPLTRLLFTPIMYTLAGYCMVMSLSFLSVAYFLMRRVLKTSSLSGIAADRSVCRRLLGSGIILSTAYFTQGAIMYLAVLDPSWPLRGIFTSNIRWIGGIFKISLIMVMVNTLLLYSKIIKQRVRTHWRKWAKSNKIWDLTTAKRHKRSKVHMRAGTEEIPFDPADIRLIRALSNVGPLHTTTLTANLSADTMTVDHSVLRMRNLSSVNINRKMTQQYDEPPIHKLQSLECIDDVRESPTDTPQPWHEQQGSFGKTITHNRCVDFEGRDRAATCIVKDEDDANSNDDISSDTDEDMMVFETVDQLFDQFIAKTEQQEIAEELYEMDQFQSEEDMMDILDDDEDESYFKINGGANEDAEEEEMIEIEMPKYDRFVCQPEVEPESISHNVPIEIESDDDNIVKSINLLELPPNMTEHDSVHSGQYQLGMAMSAETDSVKIDEVFDYEEEEHDANAEDVQTAELKGNSTNTSDARDEAILTELLESGLNSPTAGQSPKSTQKLTPPRNSSTFHFPMNPGSVSKPAADPIDTPMSPIDELQTYEKKQQRDSLKVGHSDLRSSSAPQSPRNGTKMTLDRYTKQQALEILHTAQNPTVIITPQDHKALEQNLRPGMFKSKSMQTSASHKAQTFTLSLDDNDMLADTFIDRDHSDSNSPSSSAIIPILHSKPQKRKKPAFKQWHTDVGPAPRTKPPPKPSMLFTTHGVLPNSTSDTDKLLNIDGGGFSCYPDEEDMYKDIITPQSAISREPNTDGAGRKKPILINRSYQKHIPLKTLDMDYRRMKEYKKIITEGDIISGGESNPSFWRHLKKKHAKQLNGKVLQNKFTFSFEKARYQAVLSRESIPITPCSSPRHVSKKSTVINLDNVPYIEPYVLPESHATYTTNNTHIRSSSDQSLQATDIQMHQAPSKQMQSAAPPLEPIIAAPRQIQSTKSSNLVRRINSSPTTKKKYKNKSINLELLHSAKIQNKPAQSVPNSPQTKSPLYLSSMSPSKSPLTPQPSSFKKKPHHTPTLPRPLTPLALSSKFKKRTVNRARLAEKMSISIDSPKIAHEFSKLNDKRRKLERMGSKKQLDTGGVAWKLNYWKANQLKNDPRMRALQRRRKQRRRMKRNDEALKTRGAKDRLKLKRVESDPHGKAAHGQKNKPAAVTPMSSTTSQRHVHHDKTKTKWKNALWRRFGSKERNSIKHQQQELQVHRSYNAYLGMDTEAQHSNSESVLSTSDSQHASSSSSGGEYSNSEEHKRGPYPSRSPEPMTTKKHKSKSVQKHMTRKSKNEPFRMNGEVMNEIRYNKTPIFCEGVTDSDADGVDLTNTNVHRSSLKGFTGIKANTVKYKKARTFSPRTPKQSQHNIVDIDRWEVKDVWNYIMALFPEMTCYEDNILTSKINGIDFVLMQNENDLQNLFKIQFPPHVMILLTMTRTLLMSYEGKNQKVLKAKANHSEDNLHQMML